MTSWGFGVAYRKVVIPIHHASQPTDPFEQLVLTHTQRLYQFVLSYVKSHATAEDIVQETFLLAYKHYPSYQEAGKGLAWLKAIARNVIYKQHHKNSQLTTVSICPDLQPMVQALPCTRPLPEDQLVAQERVGQMMALVDRLPPRQRMAVMCRHIHHLSVAETSARMQIPPATVKSNTSYGLKAIRKWMGENIKKGAIHMKTCKDFYGQLFEYAKGYLTPAERQEIKAHIDACGHCRQIAQGLTALWGYLQQEFIQDGYMNYFSIEFPGGEEGNISYTGMSFDIAPKQVERINRYLEENNGAFPEGEGIMQSGHDADALHLSEYAMDGQAIGFETVAGSPGYSRTYIKTFPKLYANQWTYSVYLREGYSKHVQSKEAPNLYRVQCNNNLGCDAKCGIFAWVPEGATNVRMKKGTGVLTLDGGRFAYVSQFATEDDGVHLAFSYNM